MSNKKDKLDQEEMELLKSVEAEEWHSAKNIDNEKTKK